MNPIILIAIAIGIPVTIVIIRIVIVVVGMSGNKKRSKELQQFAETSNFSFASKGDDELEKTLSRLLLFKRHRFPCLRNVMKTRINDIDVTVWDYEHSEGSPGSTSQRVYHKTVIELRSSLIQLPSFTLIPQGWLESISTSFGAPDINFDSHPTFSKQSLLFGADEKSIRKVFTGDVLDFYEEHKEWSTTGKDDRLISYKSSTYLLPSEIKSFIDEGLELFDLFKTASEEAS